MNDHEFYELAMKPEFGNEMNFQLRKGVGREDPETTFSAEGIDNLVDQFRAFLYARSAAEWERTGVGPKDIFANVKISFQAVEKAGLVMGPPWTDWQDNGVVNGEYRTKARQPGVSRDPHHGLGS